MCWSYKTLSLKLTCKSRREWSSTWDKSSSLRRTFLRKMVSSRFRARNNYQDLTKYKLSLKKRKKMQVKKDRTTKMNRCSITLKTEIPKAIKISSSERINLSGISLLRKMRETNARRKKLLSGRRKEIEINLCKSLCFRWVQLLAISVWKV